FEALAHNKTGATHGVDEPTQRTSGNRDKFYEWITDPAVQRELGDKQAKNELTRRFKIYPAAMAVDSNHAAKQFLLLDDPIGRRMRVTLREQLRLIERTPLPHNTVDNKMIFAPDEDDVAAPHVFCGRLSDQGDIFWTHPRKHARAMDSQRDASV